MAFAQGQLFQDAVPLASSCPTINEIRIADEIQDLTIEVKDGHRLNVHRIILAARIPSLRRTLSSPHRQDNSVLRWPTIPLSIASPFISYVYTGQAELTQANVRGMVSLAKMMKLSDLENWGVHFMALGVSLENLSTIWDFAQVLKICTLMEPCIHLMKTHFERLVCTDLFVRLPAESVLTLLQDDNLPVNSEEEVFAAIASWVGPGRDDVNKRLKLHALPMLKEVRWLQTSLHFRSHLMESHEIFNESKDCLKFLGQIEQWLKYEDEEKAPCPFNPNRRLATWRLFIFGKEKNQNRWSVVSFNSDLQNEERIADMEGRVGASYNAINGSIFVVGGGDSTRVDEFLVKERCWYQRASLDVARYCHAAAVVNTGGQKVLLGVFGGANTGGLSSCEVYDVSEDRWFKLPDMREKKWGLAAACIFGDSRVFVFGGFNGSSRLSSVEFCHLGADWQETATACRTANFWRPAAPMRTARNGLAATHFRGRILVAGGYAGKENFNVVEMFSLPDARCPGGQWTELAQMKQPRRYFILISSAGAVFAFGDEFGSANSVETLTAPAGSLDFASDLTTWKWSLKNPVKTLSQIEGAACIRF